MAIVNKIEYSDDTLKRAGRSIDIFKFVFCYFVIAIHVKPFINFDNYYVVQVTEQIFSVAVPFFFMASGFLTASKICSGASAGQVIKKHLYKVIKLYLIWSAAYFPLALYGLIKETDSPVAMLKSYIQQLIFVGEFNNAWHLWYILSTVYVFSLLLILSDRIKMNYTFVLCTIVVTFCVLCTGISWVMNSELICSDNIIRIIILSTIKSNRVFWGFIYIPLGMLLYQLNIGLKTAVPVFIVGYLLDVVIKNRGLSSVLAFVCFVMLFEIVINLKSGNINTVLFRNMSTSIYLIHMYVWTMLYILLYRKQTFGVLMFVMTSLSCTAIVFIWNALLIYKRSHHQGYMQRGTE